MNLAALQGLLRSLATAGAVLCGRPVQRRTRDRIVLERPILPACARRVDVRRVLFVGCTRYTRHYERLFSRAGTGQSTRGGETAAGVQAATSATGLSGSSATCRSGAST